MHIIERDNKTYVVDPVEGMLEVTYGLPLALKFCRKCVISNQRPSSPCHPNQ